MSNQREMYANAAQLQLILKHAWKEGKAEADFLGQIILSIHPSLSLVKRWELQPWDTYSRRSHGVWRPEAWIRLAMTTAPAIMSGCATGQDMCALCHKQQHSHRRQPIVVRQACSFMTLIGILAIPRYSFYKHLRKTSPSRTARVPSQLAHINPSKF